MKHILLFLLLPGSVLSQNISGTVVIIKQTHNAIYVGSDSRYTLYNDLNQIVDSGSMCKIYKTGKFYFAMVGNYALQNRDSYIAAASDTSKSLIQVIISYYKPLMNLIAEDLFRRKNNNLTEYLKFATKNKPFVCQGFFFGVDADTLFAKQVLFEIDDSGFIPEVAVKGRDTTFYVSGNVQEIQKLAYSSAVWKKGIKQAIEILIGKAATHHKREVGGKTAILKVTKQKPQWLNNGVCR